MKIKTAVCSSAGVKRRINQDNFCINGFINKKSKPFMIKSFFSSSSEQMLCICDGMGGEECGEIASLLAVQKLSSYLKKYDSFVEKFDRHSQAFALSANKTICEYMSNNSIESMGSTFALLCISPKTREAVAANVGDSKVYLYRNNLLTKLSVDHNAAQRLVDLGMISEEEALTHKEKSKLTQHLGIPSEEMIIEPAISDSILLHKGDMFLICSDGLTDMLTYTDIINIFSRKLSVKAQCKALVDKANANGGVDNITVITCKVV